MKTTNDSERELELEAIKNGLGYFKTKTDGPVYGWIIAEGVRRFMETAFAEGIIPEDVAKRSATCKRLQRAADELKLKKLNVHEKILEAKLDATEGGMDADLKAYDIAESVACSMLTKAGAITPGKLRQDAHEHYPAAPESKLDEVERIVVEHAEELGLEIAADENDVRRLAAILSTDKLVTRSHAEDVARAELGWKAKHVLDAVFKRRGELHVRFI